MIRLITAMMLLFLAPHVFADTCEAPDPSKPYQLVFEENFNGERLIVGVGILSFCGVRVSSSTTRLSITSMTDSLATIRFR